MKKALVTGFGSFGKYINNPTEWLALSVDGKVVAGYEMHSLVFSPILFNSEGVENNGEIIVKTAKEIGADVIISFGLSSNVGGFRLERSGVNWVYSEKYLSGKDNNLPLEPSRPEKEKLEADLSSWDTERIKDSFNEANIPIEPKISTDADMYFCNGLLYRTLLAMKENELNIPYLFIHCACTEESIELIPDFDRSKVLLKKEDLLKALETILKSRKD